MKHITEVSVKKLMGKDSRCTCAICGEKIGTGDTTIDHFLPQAIYKWLEPTASKTGKEKLYGGIMSKKNMIWAHKSCNYNKGCMVMNVEQLYVGDIKKEKMLKNEQQIWTYVEMFLQMKDTMLQRQGGRCYCCGKEIEDGIIRRINNIMRRTVENGCIVCQRCNQIQKNFMIE